MQSDSKRKYIKNAVEQMKKAEPYPISMLGSTPDDIFKLAETYVLNPDRISATLAKIALDKYFAEHPEDSIENYLEED